MRFAIFISLLTLTLTSNLAAMAARPTGEIVSFWRFLLITNQVPQDTTLSEIVSYAARAHDDGTIDLASDDEATAAASYISYIKMLGTSHRYDTAWKEQLHAASSRGGMLSKTLTIWIDAVSAKSTDIRSRHITDLLKIADDEQTGLADCFVAALLLTSDQLSEQANKQIAERLDDAGKKGCETAKTVYVAFLLKIQRLEDAIVEGEKRVQAEDPLAATMLAQLYMHPQFPNNSAATSVKYLRIAASGLGHTKPEVRRFLAEHYKRGSGIDKDDRRAYELYQSAYADGDALAGNELASALLFGYGNVRPDPVKAIQILENIAKSGVVDAQIQLGRFYLEGLLVERNVDVARNYFQLAANANSEVARSFLRWIDTHK